MIKYSNLLLGFLMLGLGALGAMLPVLPSTIFLIFAVYFFGKSSPKLEQKLLDHQVFGKTLKAWKYEKAISRSGKKAALLGMTLGLVILWFTVDSLYGCLAGSLGILICAIYVATRKEPSGQI